MYEATQNNHASKVLSKLQAYFKNIPLITIFLFGTFLMSGAILLHVHSLWKLSFITSAAANQMQIQNPGSPPTFLYMPRVNISLPVAQTVVVNNIWEVAQIGASHLKSSANPGTNGNSIFYAHNTQDRFGPLFWVEKGDEVRVTTADGVLHSYTIEKTAIISPTETEILSQTKTEVITLYTCYGFADLKRFVVIARPTKYIP